MAGGHDLTIRTIVGYYLRLINCVLERLAWKGVMMALSKNGRQIPSVTTSIVMIPIVFGMELSVIDVRIDRDQQCANKKS